MNTISFYYNNPKKLHWYTLNFPMTKVPIEKAEFLLKKARLETQLKLR